MKQILQNLRTGELLLQDVAVPGVKPGHLLIQTTCSLISAGTERMLVDFGRAGYIAKAKQQPEKVKQVLDKIRTDGLLPTMEAVFAKLDQPIPLGYCNVGRVLEVGKGVEGLKIGDRVSSNGNHAEVVSVPVSLCAKIPDEVPDEQAAFTVISSIALHGIRLLNPTLGETVAVFGLGLIGLVAVQMLKANGARVIGFDYDGNRVEVARSYGVTAVDISTGSDPVQAAMTFSGDRGVDGVLVTAATQSHDLMHQAASMSRKRGRIILTGVVGLNLRRSDFYEKELTFQVSCSYGPGRYDPSYEEDGQDYPFGYVRWTEQRNFEAVLELMREKRLSFEDLVSANIPIERAGEAYKAISQKSIISVLLRYPDFSIDSVPEKLTTRIVSHLPARSSVAGVVLGVIGSGNFTRLRILPALKKSGAHLKWIASLNGVSGATAATKFGIEKSTTDYRNVISDPGVNAVVVATRHDTHARMVMEALEAGKSVFVEKPLCLHREELDAIVEAYDQASSSGARRPILMVGYNRRFAPLVTLIRSKTGGRQTPLAVTMTCNAGAIPADHWVHDPEIGGGRLLGEACHFIDLLHFLVGSPISQVAALKQTTPGMQDLEDTFSISLKFQDGSLGQINYFSSGSKDYPKEQLDVFYEGRVIRLDNFKRVDAFGSAKFKSKRVWTQDKGHEAGFLSFVDAVKNGRESPISLDSIINTTRATFAALEAMRTGKVIEIL